MSYFDEFLKKNAKFPQLLLIKYERLAMEKENVMNLRAITLEDLEELRPYVEAGEKYLKSQENLKQRDLEMSENYPNIENFKDSNGLLGPMKTE